MTGRFAEIRFGGFHRVRERDIGMPEVTPDAGPAPGESLRILVVEDEVLIALELECLLEDLGHVSVGVASASAEAIALGQRTAPDVALVDIHLIDGPTGVEVARALSADPRTTVVFMTANAKRIPPDFAGAVGVIAKPYSERTVASALDYVARCRSGQGAGDISSGETLDGFRLAPGAAG